MNERKKKEMKFYHSELKLDDNTRRKFFGPEQIIKEEKKFEPKKIHGNDDPRLVIVQHPIEGNLVLLKSEKLSYLNVLEKKFQK